MERTTKHPIPALGGRRTGRGRFKRIVSWPSTQRSGAAYPGYVFSEIGCQTAKKNKTATFTYVHAAW